MVIIQRLFSKIYQSTSGVWVLVFSILIFPVLVFIFSYHDGLATGFLNFLANIFIYKYIFVEALLAIVLITICFHIKSKVAPIVGSALIFIYCVVMLAQTSSLYITGHIIPRVAFENIMYLNLLNIKTVIFVGAVTAVFLGWLYAVRKNIKTVFMSKKLYTLLIIILVCIGGVFIFDVILHSKMSEIKRDFYLNNKVVPSMVVVDFFSNFIHINPNTRSFSGFSYAEGRRLKELGFTFDQESEKPLQKSKIYDSKQFYSSDISKPNLIVLYPDGISARSIGPYNEQFRDVTPNLNSFAQESTTFKNYYNHTAATYRGLLGQLCSLYPYTGIDNKNEQGEYIQYDCLTHVLNDEGYHTYFVSSEEGDPLTHDFIQSFNFDDVIVPRDLMNSSTAPEHISDQEFYLEFREHMFEQEYFQEPFLIVGYTFQTHAFLDNLSTYDVRYQDGGNSALNTLHNFDDAFGKFWDAFQDSRYADNTILVVTTDHARYPERIFSDLFKDDPSYKNFFIDEIMLILYDQNKLLPSEYDARNASSVDLAPTLLHYLGVSNRTNSFVGSSIFERNTDTSFGAYENTRRIITNQGVFSDGYNKKTKEDMTIFNKFLLQQIQLEQTDRL